MIKSVIIGQIATALRPLSFNLWVPRPPHLARSGFDPALQRKFAEGLHEYEWCRNNWGCERDGVDFQVEVWNLPAQVRQLPECKLTFLSERVPFPVYTAIAHSAFGDVHVVWCSDLADEAGSLTFSSQTGHCDAGSCRCPVTGVIIRKLPGRTLMEEWAPGMVEDWRDPNWKPKDQRDTTIKGNERLKEAHAALWRPVPAETGP